MLRRLRLLILLGGCLAALGACLSPVPTETPPAPSSFPTVKASWPVTQVASSPALSPTVARPTLVAEPTVTPMLPQVLSGTWRFWPSAYEPQAVSDIAIDDAIWVGTSFGVIRFDPTTQNHTLFKHPGSVRQILSSTNGPIIATQFDEYWYFDGQTWIPTRFLGSDELWSEELIGVDVNGDLWLHAIMVAARSYRTLRFNGHVPPPDDKWVSAEEVTFTEHEPLDCAWWRVYRSSTFTCRSPEM